MNQLEDMQTFVRIVEAGSITKAAEQLDTVKSAVSRRLSELEKRLGVSLLTRTTRTQTLTTTGESYYQQCLRLIDDFAEVESSIKNEHCSLVGRIKIAAPLSFGIAHLGPALRQFNEINPEIRFDVDFNDRKIDLIEEGFDVAIRIAHLADSSLIAKRLTDVKLVLSASPGYLKKYGRPKTPQDLNKGHVKLQYSDQPDSWHFTASQGKDSKGKSFNIKIPAVLKANNGEFLCQAAIDGIGLIYTPDFICYKAIRLGQLEPILCEFIADNRINAYAVYPQTRHLSKRVRSLIDYLTLYFGDEPYWRIS
ncbi:MAG: LysR family transcriptional regulator [Gammaproteobacteria bacterium]|nr:MAG: LysR family transcriptional regulator [Gammaproteobacteria bacterium]